MRSSLTYTSRPACSVNFPIFSTAILLTLAKWHALNLECRSLDVTRLPAGLRTLPVQAAGIGVLATTGHTVELLVNAHILMMSLGFLSAKVVYGALTVCILITILKKENVNGHLAAHL